MSYRRFAALAALAGMVLAGCVAIPADRGAAATHVLLETRSATAGSMSLAPLAVDAAEEFNTRLLGVPIGATEAVQLALLNSPRMRLLYAELGLAQGEVYDATRLANPSLGYLRLTPEGGRGSKSTWSIAQDFTQLLFVGYRNRAGRAQALRAQQRVAHAVLQIEADVREAFFVHAGAQLTARIRTAVAYGAKASAELAARFHDAGNISLLQRSREEAVASEASIGARRAKTNALVARRNLLNLLGLRIDDARPRFVEQLNLPMAPSENESVLQGLGLQQRLDLAALRTESGMRQQELTHVRRWRWLGGLSLGAERERELDGEVLSGPGGNLELPLFNSGKGIYLRSSAMAEIAAAKLAIMETEIGNDIAVQCAALEASRLDVEDYRKTLVPLQERIVDSSQREQNFMLIGAFELLLARREEVETYERYVDAVRDYWIARTRLARSVGGALPGDAVQGEPLLLPELPGDDVAFQSIPGGAQ